MIEDKELSILVPKDKWHQMENKIQELQDLTNVLLVPGDNIVIIQTERKQKAILNKYYRWETYKYTEIEAEGGGNIIQSLLYNQKFDFEMILSSGDFSRPESENLQFAQNKQLEDENRNLKQNVEFLKYDLDRKSPAITRLRILSAILAIAFFATLIIATR